jgi:hypothetical protein
VNNRFLRRQHRRCLRSNAAGIWVARRRNNAKGGLPRGVVVRFIEPITYLD